jgi:transposase
MPPPLSLDLRTRVLADFRAGATFAALGRKYTVSAEWVRRFIRRYQATGEIAARPPVNRRVPFHRRHEAELRAAVAADPSLTLAALRTRLGVACDLSTLWHALRALKISFKKRHSSRRSGTARMSPPAGPSSASSGPPASTRGGSSSSTRRGSRRT